ncbi:MAG: hypothetical protein ACPGYF_05105 [Chitinophagales bacterium]
MKISILLFLILCHSQVSSQRFAGDYNQALMESQIVEAISNRLSDGDIFMTSDNEYFIVIRGSNERIPLRHPKMEFIEDGNRYEVAVEDLEDVLVCEKLHSYYHTQIEGEFEGWDGATKFRMMDGQIWQQSTYDYHYYYAYSPRVFMYNYNGSWFLKVENDSRIVEVFRVN